MKMNALKEPHYMEKIKAINVVMGNMNIIKRNLNIVIYILRKRENHIKKLVKL